MSLTLQSRPQLAPADPGGRVSNLEAPDRALLALADALHQRGYRFTCVTPETHARVAARHARQFASEPATLRAIFGWSLPFDEADLAPQLLELLRRANALSHVEGRLKSDVRYANFDQTLLVHSAWPTVAANAVFFGPDTYRFASLIERTLCDGVALPRTVVDLGCGTGAGGILVARLLDADERMRVIFTDINAQALRYAQINALHAGVANFSCQHSDILKTVADPIDLIVANPPYLLDPQQRAYRHGGGALGTGLSVRIVEESMQRLASGGRLILYTATPIVDGVDTLRRQLSPLIDGPAAAGRIDYCYSEIDPDVFGSELDYAAYARVERIAVVGLTIRVS